VRRVAAEARALGWIVALLEDPRLTRGESPQDLAAALADVQGFMATETGPAAADLGAAREATRAFEVGRSTRAEELAEIDRALRRRGGVT
jgi:hypothetical protein